MKKTLTTLALSVLGLISFAQQDFQISMNMFSRLPVNPGYAGTNQALCATLIGRHQWMGFPGAPKTYLLAADIFQSKLHGGAGLTLFSDQLGFDNSFMAKLSYSFHLPLGPGLIGLGADVGLFQKSLGGDWIAIDPVASDNTIPASAKSSTIDVGFGAYYTIPNKVYFGISSTHLPQSKFTDKTKTYEEYEFEMRRHYYLMAGYDYPLPNNPSLVLKPSVLVKSDATSTQLDINLLAEFQNQFWGGISYRLADAIVPMLGANFTPGGGTLNYKIGYAYYVTTSSIRSHSSGSHEIMLGICHKIQPKIKIQSHENPRNLQ